jgi:hypothetical protein
MQVLTYRATVPTCATRRRGSFLTYRMYAQAVKYPWSTWSYLRPSPLEHSLASCCIFGFLRSHLTPRLHSPLEAASARFHSPSRRHTLPLGANDMIDTWPNTAGFDTDYEELEPVELVVRGKIPNYTAGVLCR